MREDVDVRPPGEIQPSARRQEVESCLRKVSAAFTGQAFIQLFFQAMKVKDIGGRLRQLSLGQLPGTPVAHLLEF